jgi:hypothetical protein
MNVSAKIRPSPGKLTVGLPITSPTGKIRVKRAIAPFDFGTPVATRRENLDKTCYVEWQIGYDTEDPSTEGCAPEISFIRKGKTKYGHELTVLLYQGIKTGVFTEKILDELDTYCSKIGESDFLDKQVKICRVFTKRHKFLTAEFKAIEERYPMFHFEGKDFNIEVIVRHMQRAVGYQAMIYVSLPLKIMKEKLDGRPAESKEFCHFDITPANGNLVIDTLKVFALASKQHREDIMNIVRAVRKRVQ